MLVGDRVLLTLGQQDGIADVVVALNRARKKDIAPAITVYVRNGDVLGASCGPTN